jgi:phosphoenolpyruvate carboxykinase (ATP)
MIQNAMDGKLDKIPTRNDMIFNLEVPEECPGVPAELFDPPLVWKDRAAYQSTAHALANHFKENFKQFEKAVSVGVIQAGPR